MPAPALCKAFVAITAVITLALACMGAAPSLATRLAEHGAAIAPADPDQATRYIELTLARLSYEVIRRDDGRQHTVEVTLANPASTHVPTRTFIIGAFYGPGASDKGRGAAAVIELAHLLRHLRPAVATQVKFVFFVGSSVSFLPADGSFIAFAGERATAHLVRGALASMRLPSTFPLEGLSAPFYVEGVTTSGRLMITGATLHYPYSHATPATPDHPTFAADVASLAHLIAALAVPPTT
ncbi:MAG: hypothetical protein V4484_22840 [Pseudomonadota bacterium]